MERVMQQAYRLEVIPAFAEDVERVNVDRATEVEYSNAD